MVTIELEPLRDPEAMDDTSVAEVALVVSGLGTFRVRLAVTPAGHAPETLGAWYRDVLHAEAWRVGVDGEGMDDSEDGEEPIRDWGDRLPPDDEEGMPPPADATLRWAFTPHGGVLVAYDPDSKGRLPLSTQGKVFCPVHWDGGAGVFDAERFPVGTRCPTCVSYLEQGEPVPVMGDPYAEMRLAKKREAARKKAARGGSRGKA